MSGNPSGPPFRGIQQCNVRHDDSSTLIDGNELWTTPINNISPYEAYNRDNQRILAYRNAIMRLHEKYMKGKIVLDMSKKNGTYAGFALRAGAAKCYVVEGSLKEADHTRSILELNGYDTRCVVKQCEIKDLTIDEEHVDVILHESMGECLFVMSGIKDVIEARDKFLRPKHGLILPNEATLHLVGINNEDLRQISIDFWCRPIEGLSLEGLREVALSEPEMAYIQPEMVVTKETFLQRFNLYNVSLRHLCVDVPFFVETQKSCNITAFVAFFKEDFGRLNDLAETKTELSTSPLSKVDFGQWNDPAETKTGLSTSPLSKVTGWDHCVFPINKVIPVQGKGQQIDGRFRFHSTKPDLTTDFAAELMISHHRKGKNPIFEKRTYTFYNN